MVDSPNGSFISIQQSCNFRVGHALVLAVIDDGFEDSDTSIAKDVGGKIEKFAPWCWSFLHYFCSTTL
jgi:hypothetical protein